MRQLSCPSLYLISPPLTSLPYDYLEFFFSHSTPPLGLEQAEGLALSLPSRPTRPSSSLSSELPPISGVIRQRSTPLAAFDHTSPPREPTPSSDKGLRRIASTGLLQERRAPEARLLPPPASNTRPISAVGRPISPGRAFVPPPSPSRFRRA